MATERPGVATAEHAKLMETARRWAQGAHAVATTVTDTRRHSRAPDSLSGSIGGIYHPENKGSKMKKSSHVVGDLSSRGQERRAKLIEEAAAPQPKASELEYVAWHSDMLDGNAPYARSARRRD